MDQFPGKWAYSRPKLSDLYTLSQSKLLENHTLHSGTYLYSPYMVDPNPPGVHVLSLNFKPVVSRIEEEAMLLSVFFGTEITGETKTQPC